MPEQQKPNNVGLDIGSERLDYCISLTDEGMFPNTPNGRAALVAKLKTLPRPRVICESSGGYQKPIVAELQAAGIEVCVVLPQRVRHFAESEGSLAKTDKLDARLLRRYGESISNLRLAEPVPPQLTILRELLEHRRALTTQKTEVEGRFPLAGPTLTKLLQRQQTFLRKELENVDNQIRRHINNDPDLRQKSERLQQIAGVGPVVAATTLAYMPELGKVDSAVISALIGVAPYPKDSGKYSGSRHIRGGRSQVRSVLYMAAVTASQHNPILAKLYQRLTQHGKPHKVCITAIMRKLACLMNLLIQNPTFVLVS